MNPRFLSDVDLSASPSAQVRAHDAEAADAYGARVDRVEALLQPYNNPSYCMASSQVEWQPYKPPPLPALSQARARRGGGVTGGSAGGARARGAAMKLSEAGSHCEQAPPTLNILLLFLHGGHRTSTQPTSNLVFLLSASI